MKKDKSFLFLVNKMVFPPRKFHAQGTHFEPHRPYSLGLANQQTGKYCRDGSGDKCVDYINDKLSDVVKDPSFDSRNWASNAPVHTPATRLPGQHGPGLVGPVEERSVLPQVAMIIGVATVAAILAYYRPDLFANLFKLFIGYELISLIVGAVLVLLGLGAYLWGLHLRK